MRELYTDSPEAISAVETQLYRRSLLLRNIKSWHRYKMFEKHTHTEACLPLHIYTGKKGFLDNKQGKLTFLAIGIFESNNYSTLF